MEEIPMKITKQDLINKEACQSGITDFEKIFPEGFQEDNLHQYHGQHLLSLLCFCCQRQAFSASIGPDLFQHKTDDMLDVFFYGKRGSVNHGQNFFWHHEQILREASPRHILGKPLFLPWKAINWAKHSHGF